MKKIRALIVDDEELARCDLRALLTDIKNVEIIDEANSIASALRSIRKSDPDVIFLDIQFPRESGFDLLEKIETKAKIIFVTAFDKYAIRAFEVNALDYLIKPVDASRLAITLERIEESNQSKNEKAPFNYSDSVFIEHDNNFYFVKLNTIIMISAIGAYTEIVTSMGHKMTAHKSMKEWETRLPDNTFVRIHRSTIINIDHIEKIDRWYNYSLRVYMTGIDAPIPISRRYVAAIRERMT